MKAIRIKPWGYRAQVLEKGTPEPYFTDRLDKLIDRKNIGEFESVEVIELEEEGPKKS